MITTRQDKRRLMLESASATFGAEGYERASIDAVAAAAGVSKPTVYAYFGSKEQLFREAMADVARKLSEASYEAVCRLDVRTDRWRESLHDLAVALVNCQNSGCAAALSRLVLGESQRDPQVFHEVLRAGYQPILEALAGRLAMLGNAGMLDITDASLAARHFIALTQAEMTELTLGGTIEGNTDQITRSVEAGVDAFLQAYGLLGHDCA